MKRILSKSKVGLIQSKDQHYAPSLINIQIKATNLQIRLKVQGDSQLPSTQLHTMNFEIGASKLIQLFPPLLLVLLPSCSKVSGSLAAAGR